MFYFTNAGPTTGPILWRDGYAALSELRARDDHRPIGMALEVGWGEGGASLWKLTVHGVEVPGRWIVVGREFWPAHDDGHRPRGCVRPANETR
jgi:hypothetical protein